MTNNVTQKTVLNLLSAAMFQNPLNVDNEVDWNLVFDECQAQSGVKNVVVICGNGCVMFLL